MEARDYHARAARLLAQRYYFRGIVTSMIPIFILLLFGIAGLFFYTPEKVNDDLYSALSLLLFGFLGGSIGAIVSVMSRISSGNLELDYEVGLHMARRVGVFRPIIGLVFGGLICTLITANFLPIQLPEHSYQFSFLGAVLGFIAGFSERWVPELLAHTRKEFTIGSLTPEVDSFASDIAGASKESMRSNQEGQIR